MKKVLLLSLLSLLVILPAAVARDYITPRIAMARFDACIKFLKMSPANQEKVARKTTFGRAEGIRMCRNMIARGRKKTLEDAKEWNRWEASQGKRRGGGGGSYEGPPSCSSRNSCGALEHCYNGQCVSTSNHCISDSQCTGGGTCGSDGTCR